MTEEWLAEIRRDLRSLGLGELRYATAALLDEIAHLRTVNEELRERNRVKRNGW